MNDTIRFYLSLSIIFAAILGVIKFRRMDPAYHPFVYYACQVVLIEVIVYVLLAGGLANLAGITLNIYALTEFYLLTLLFHNWGLFKRKKNIFLSILAIFFFLFFATMFIRGYARRNHFASIISSFVLIFFSISSFNKMILNERINIFKNAKFWICIGIAIYYTCSVLVSAEMFFIISLTHKVTQEFKDNVFQINVYANLFVNLLYAVAVIWIPKKKNITTLL
ncbi:MAG: hypothetical protein NVSMB7_16360 [Chitinophagaceae bacterium]